MKTVKKALKTKIPLSPINICRSIKAVIPSGIQYSNTDHFLSVSRQVNKESQIDPTVIQIDNYLGEKIREYFKTYQDFQRAKDAETSGHRFDTIDGVRFPHVTNIISPDEPPIPNIEDHANLGHAFDRLFKTWATTSKIIPEEFKDSGNIKQTYQEIVEAFTLWIEAQGKDVRVTDVNVRVLNKDFGYCGELDAIGFYKDTPAIFDAKKSKAVKGEIKENYFMQTAAYSKCLETVPEIMVICTPYDLVWSSEVDKYFGKFLLKRGRYQERFNI